MVVCSCPGPAMRTPAGPSIGARAVQGPEYRPADPTSDPRLPAGNLPIGRLRSGRLPDRKLPVSNLPVSKLPAGNKIQYWTSRVFIILILFFDLRCARENNFSPAAAAGRTRASLGVVAF